MSFRNRMLIAGANGIIVLTVPIEQGRDSRAPIRDTKIARHYRWQQQHWRSIFSCYNHSPWFEFYRDELEELYKRPADFLWDWNLACFEWIQQKLDWKARIHFTASFAKEYDPNGWTDRRNYFLPKNYRHFEPVRYRQVFEDRTGFLPNLSILDLLFCSGPAAGKLLIETC